VQLIEKRILSRLGGGGGGGGVVIVGGGVWWRGGGAHTPVAPFRRGTTPSAALPLGFSLYWQCRA